MAHRLGPGRPLLLVAFITQPALVNLRNAASVVFSLTDRWSARPWSLRDSGIMAMPWRRRWPTDRLRNV